ncbi:D-2-hydroxyacid dehydrogenase family protein [Azospirillum rugosum]|uniref:Phosphoglycerate dehydrogenase-like enzyme n=1 Tax=Azospirillum rugosum TaxID=416170 RepID=A0ABS4SUW3_9PROT|nr:D-2-hydroxyacid dehydrogenase family protein [Azospirillum rugosum]MBP2296349.1 phosphoglycerate dehydrogenase-like enzyme [Azospirillum rugosum]MDQ0529870.1 phosphoglycerate dehydrogenase-like enzyme [Azospirillum rugosum]
MKIAILDDYQNVARDLAEWHQLPNGSALTVFDRPIPADEVAAALEPYDVLVIMRERTPFPASLIDRLPNLRLLVTTGQRNNAIDLAACQARGIPVCGTRMVGTPTAELTWGLILALVKRIPAEERALREGRWQTGLTQGLAGKRLGLVGLGKLGTQVAAVGRAFGMEVAAWSPNLTDERAAAAGAARLDKRELFATSDIVSVHLVLSDRTRGVVGAEEFAAMKPTALFVNTSRAGLVDETALLAALHEHCIAGAGIDVYPVEPLPAGSPWLDAPNTVLTPHLGYVTRENCEVFYRDALEDILAWRAGNPVRVLGA